MSGPAWESVRVAAAQGFYPPVVSDVSDPSNVYCLAAGIVYARTGTDAYRQKVVRACEYLVEQGKPGGNTLAWARNVGAFAMAADLVKYRSRSFESWLRAVAEQWKGTDGRTLLEMFKKRPNNWGAMAFGSLAAIYVYLQDSARLVEIRQYWMRGVTGPNPGYKYGSDMSWHLDPDDPRLINPRGARKCGLDIDGVIPDDQRRSGSFSTRPAYTNYHWGHLQGLVTAARVLERAGMPIWDVGDSAICRAASLYQVRWEEQFGDFHARGDDEWLPPFLDAAYGTRWSADQPHLWEHGKIAGWPYVVWQAPCTVSRGSTAGQGVCISLRSFPNPTRQVTNIAYTLPQPGVVTLVVYSATGKLVATLEQAYRAAGKYSCRWNGRDSRGFPVPSGVYLCRLQTSWQHRMVKLVVVH